ncbi:hypothetical protein EV715DRAFT_257154 [Schizophyllum commune]
MTHAQIRALAQLFTCHLARGSPAMRFLSINILDTPQPVCKPSSHDRDATVAITQLTRLSLTLRSPRSLLDDR